MQDPELKDKLPLGDDTTSTDPFTEGLYVTGLAQEQVDVYGEFINDLYAKVTTKHERQVTRSAVTMLKGAIFAVGTRKQQNPEWKEHCASSLREIFHEWNDASFFNGDFVLFFRGKGEGLTDDESRDLKSFWLLYDYFCGIDHHNAAKVLHSLRAIMRDSSLKLEDCFKEEIFIERVKDFFSKVARIIEISKNNKQAL